MTDRPSFPNDYDGPMRDDDDASPEVAAFDRLIADAARAYHRPPVAVPRDAMWDAIVATRAARGPAAAPVAASPATNVVSLDAVRRRRTAWTFAAAASLLLAAGIGMGRWYEGNAQQAAQRATQVAAQVAARGPATPPVSDATPSSAPTVASIDEPTPPVGLGSAEPRAATAAPAPLRAPTARVADRTAGRTPDRTLATSRVRDGAGTLAYDIATVRHLTNVEALLVSYRADPLDSLADVRVAAWARSLLQDTRLLLDSPAAASPMRRRLFEDLELVLVQMTRLASADSASGPTQIRREREERALIDGTMRDARVLPRLRRAIPAGTGT